MTELEGFADAHMHLPEGGRGYPDAGDASLLLLCSVTRDTWEAVRAFDCPGAVRFYGIHPWNADEWSEETREELLTFLERDRSAGVGEIGLDGRRGDPEAQAKAFSEQLRISSEMDRVANVHAVACDKQLLDSLSSMGRDVPRTIVHGFSNESYAVPLTRLGCYLSVNPRVLARSDRRVERLMSSIPEDRLLLETDFPYVPGWFSGMRDYASRLAEASGRDPGHLLEVALENARRVVHGRGHDIED